MRQLSDPTCYELIDWETYRWTIHECHGLLSDWYYRGLLDTDEYNFLRTEKPRIPCIYFLPKNHKNPTSPPGRPIVSSNGSLLENTSILDLYLSNYVCNLRSFCKDSTDFLRIIHDVQWKEGFLLIGLDVCSLYTCIDHATAWWVCNCLSDCANWIWDETLMVAAKTQSGLELLWRLHRPNWSCNRGCDWCPHWEIELLCHRPNT